MEQQNPEERIADLERQADGRAADDPWLVGLAVLFGLYVGRQVLVKGVLPHSHIVGLLFLAVSAGLVVFYVIKRLRRRR
jgi:hypothetical protein